jgi:histidinol dehydrogenase
VAVLNRLDLRGRGSDVAGRLPRPHLTGDEPVAAVREIIERVRSEGDDALIELTARFDGVRLEQLRVPAEELAAAAERIDPVLRSALDTAAEAIDGFHRAQLRPPHVVEQPGVRIRAYQRPVDRAGLYVPGGRAQYPSTVLMTAVPARVAGVPEVVVCVPPNRDTGGIPDPVLAAAHIAGVDELYAVGGAQAVAAMAYGTASIRPVDVIGGPGNVYVAIAKREVAGQVGVPAAFAGPSEVVVVADASVDPVFAAVDVLVQAEHGPDGLAWLVTWDEQAAERIDAAVGRLVAESPRADDIRATLAEGGYLALVDDAAAALAVVDAIAPEHLQLMCAGAEELAGRVRNAGAIFCGPWSPASIGDYVAGPSHVLPTFGTARFASALTVGDFLKDHHVVTVDPSGLERLGPHVVALAECEGLDTHARSIRLRLGEGDRP